MTLSLLILIGWMVLSSIVCVFGRKSKYIDKVMPFCTLVQLVLAAVLCIPIIDGEILDDGLFYMDGMSAVFMMLVAIVGSMASVYSMAYVGYESDEGEILTRDIGQYYALMMVFISVMMLTFTARSMAIVWLGIGATTLVSTFLVGFHTNEESTEAAWKYIILCSVGITIALAGYTLVYASTIGVVDSGASFDWPALMAAADSLDPALMKMAMVLIIVGFGTKVGFVPLHAWLPDAHSQAPSPVSGLLSAVLLNCAMYGVLRFYSISELVNPGFASSLLLVFGVISLVIAALFMVSSKDLKRMLAYSSIENMGLIAISFGIGSPLAIAGAILQLIAHSITKPILFFSAGNIIQAYGTRNMREIHGLGRTMPFSAFMLSAGSLAIVGAPPFAVFVSEFTLLSASIDSGMVWLTVAMVLALAIVFAGFTKNIFPMMLGGCDRRIEDDGHPSRFVPLAVLFVLTLMLGLFMPEQLKDCIIGIVHTIEGVALW